MALWVAVHGVKNNEQVEETTFNRPIFELVERTNYLYSRMQTVIGSNAFDSLRLVDIALESTGSGVPVVGDLVYLNSATGTYAKAVATPSTIDVFSADNSAYTVGLLISKLANVGTIVLTGRVNLSTGGSGWNLANIVETGETFRNGPYYLSSVEAGKMTAEPHGPAIYVGYFMEDPNNPGYGGFAILSPQYKDMKEAHVHRAYQLQSQVAGTQVLSGPTPADTHTIYGFDPVTPQPGGDHTPRIVITGTWLGSADTQYTIWLSNSNSAAEDRTLSSPPTSWADCYLHWNSSDANEPAGVARIWSYETLTAIGTKGLYANLENTLTTDWDDPYTVAADTYDKRSWIIQVPTATRGWLARKWRQYCSNYPAVDYNNSFVVIGGPHSSTDGRLWDTLTVKCANIFTVAYTTDPVAAEKITVNGTDFIFGTDIEIVTGDPEQSFLNMMDAILEANLTGVDVAIDTEEAKLVIGTTAAGTVTSTVTGTSVVNASSGAGSLVTGNVGLMVYDQNHYSLVPTTSFWNNAAYWTPQDLTNGLSIMPIPYSYAGTAATSGAVAVADYWNASISDEAPDTKFVYAIGMDQVLYKHYPPIPFDAASMIQNGIEIESYHLFPTAPVYRLSSHGIYWYSGISGEVPWPRDWVSVANPGSPEYAEHIAIHFVKMSLGNTGIVTSLRPAPDSPIRVLECGTNQDGTVGDLAIDLDLNLVTEDAALEGYQVIKSFDGAKMLRGPVVERIIPGPGISITQAPGTPAGQGIVTVSSDTSAFNGEFETIALENAKQEKIGMFPYIKLLNWQNAGTNINTGFAAKFRVPHTMGYGVSPLPKYKVVVYMTVFGESGILSGTDMQYAGISFEYSILPDFFAISYDGASTEAWNTLNDSLPKGLLTVTSPIHADIPFGKTGGSPVYSAYDPMLIHNNNAEDYPDEERRIVQVLGNPFPVKAELSNWTLPDDPVVRPGSIVGIRVRRANVTAGLPEYTGAIGFINIRWRLLSV